jgi:ATP-dependent RNA helicase RhlE
MTFEELNLTKPLLRALEDLKMIHPTSIQEKTYPVVLSGRDVLGIAQTGTGKTFAYLLPLLRLWKFSKDRFAQIVILVPTRELVVQVIASIEQLTPYMNTVAVGAYGGVNIKVHMDEVEQGLDILVATPGRMLDLIFKGSLNVKHIKKLVIDEVDEMLHLGFRSQLTQILDLLPEKRQNLLFSATLSEDVDGLIETYFNNPIIIEAAPAGTPLDNIDQSLYRVPNFYTKINLLAYLLDTDEQMRKVLVFVSTKALADQVYETLTELSSYSVGIIHSNKDQNFRLNAVRQFDSGATKVLIATDIIARGLDIANVSHVINFDFPETPEDYIHRIGRTGRLLQKGIAISFVTVKEEEFLVAAESYMQFQVPIVDFPDDVYVDEKQAPHEIETVSMKSVPVTIIPRDETNSAFHEKLDKNKKVNKRVTKKDVMMAKYGKPQKRGSKPRGKKKR